MQVLHANLFLPLYIFFHVNALETEVNEHLRNCWLHVFFLLVSFYPVHVLSDSVLQANFLVIIIVLVPQFYSQDTK